jgi:hypothetical protein
MDARTLVYEVRISVQAYEQRISHFHRISGTEGRTPGLGLHLDKPLNGISFARWNGDFELEKTTSLR